MTVYLKNLDLSKIKVQKRSNALTNRPQVTPFPVKLHRMLTAVEQDGLEHIVSWNPDGRSFQVHSHDQFVAEVLPASFRQSKYKSFQRQLNFYCFQRVTSGPQEGAYGHPNFIRGNEEAAKAIKRQKQQMKQAQQQQQQQRYGQRQQAMRSSAALSAVWGLPSSLPGLRDSVPSTVNNTHSFSYMAALHPMANEFDNSNVLNSNHTIESTMRSVHDLPDEDDISGVLSEFRGGRSSMSSITVNRESSKSIQNELNERSFNADIKAGGANPRLSFVGRSFFHLPMDFPDI